ncbi:MAG TPA: hypothetical protein VLT45_16820, partial [Kofleriaceae bacterium]|nr:hypothetical protein [Kofleriaceae bacterium]
MKRRIDSERMAPPAVVLANNAERARCDADLMARMNGSKNSQSAKGAETKAPTAAVPAAEPATRYRGVT